MQQKGNWLVFTLTIFTLSLTPLFAHAQAATDFISGSQARELISTQGAILVDVRTPEEFKIKHVSGALHFPVQTLEADLYHFGDFKRPIIVYCRSGKRAAVAQELLLKAGYQQVFNMGPLENWDK